MVQYLFCPYLSSYCGQTPAIPLFPFFRRTVLYGIAVDEIELGRCLDNDHVDIQQERKDVIYCIVILLLQNFVSIFIDVDQYFPRNLLNQYFGIYDGLSLVGKTMVY